jgi:hypothetical protein
MPYQLTPYDWLVLSGLAVNGVAFWLMFGPTPRAMRGSSTPSALPDKPRQPVVARDHGPPVDPCL